MSGRGSVTAMHWAVAALAVCAVASCSDANGPGGVLSLQFDKVPMPALVLGDSLRDTLGVAAPLRAHAFGSGTTELAGVPIRYMSLDTGIKVDSIGGWVVATARRTTVARVVATVAGLQTQPESLAVALRPDTVSKAAAVPPIVYVTVPPTSPQNTSGSLSVRVGSFPAVPGPATDSVSGNWLVRYTLVRAATVAADSTLLVGAAAGAQAAFGVTDLATGVATKVVRIVPKLGTRLKDTVIVDASVAYKGVAVRGSPVRFIVPLTPADSLP
jgi:hypothetical protein